MGVLRWHTVGKPILRCPRPFGTVPFFPLLLLYPKLLQKKRIYSISLASHWLLGHLGRSSFDRGVFIFGPNWNSPYFKGIARHGGTSWRVHVMGRWRRMVVAVEEVLRFPISRHSDWLELGFIGRRSVVVEIAKNRVYTGTWRVRTQTRITSGLAQPIKNAGFYQWCKSPARAWDSWHVHSRVIRVRKEPLNKVFSA